MNILIIILLSLVGIIILISTLGLFMKKEHYVNCEITINAPRQKVFDYLKIMKNQYNFNKHAMADKDREEEYKGTDGTVGFTISWNGNKNVGEGQKEIINIIEGKKIETEIRFVRPMTTSATIIMETASLSDNETKVTWSNAGTLKYPVNLFIPMMEKHVKKDMDESLVILKNILEQ